MTSTVDALSAPSRSKRSAFGQSLSSTRLVYRKHRRRCGRYRKGKLLGTGATGEVFQGHDQLTGQFVAIKEIKNSASKEVMKEIETLQKLDHKNIVRYYECDKEPCGTLIIYMELVDGGSLLSLVQQFGHLTEQVISCYATQIISGLSYLHRNGVLHRDIKPANLLYTTQGVVKLADFGTCQICEDDEGARTLAGKFVGTVAYASPEAIKGRNQKASDVWEMGMTMCELATGRSAWEGVLSCDNPLEFMLKVANTDATPLIPTSLSSTLRKFLAGCLHRDPSKRLTLQTLAAHPFLYSFDHSASFSLPIMGSGVLTSGVMTEVGKSVVDPSTQTAPIADPFECINHVCESEDEGEINVDNQEVKREAHLATSTPEGEKEDLAVTDMRGVFIAAHFCNEDIAVTLFDGIVDRSNAASSVSLRHCVPPGQSLSNLNVSGSPTFLADRTIDFDDGLFDRTDRQKKYIPVSGTKDGLIVLKGLEARMQAQLFPEGPPQEEHYSDIGAHSVRSEGEGSPPQTSPLVLREAVGGLGRSLACFTDPSNDSFRQSTGTSSILHDSRNNTVFSADRFSKDYERLCGAIPADSILEERQDSEQTEQMEPGSPTTISDQNDGEHSTCTVATQPIAKNPKTGLFAPEIAVKEEGSSASSGSNPRPKKNVASSPTIPNESEADKNFKFDVFFDETTRPSDFFTRIGVPILETMLMDRASPPEPLTPNAPLPKCRNKKISLACTAMVYSGETCLTIGKTDPKTDFYTEGRGFIPLFVDELYQKCAGKYHIYLSSLSTKRDKKALFDDIHHKLFTEPRVVNTWANLGPLVRKHTATYTQAIREMDLCQLAFTTVMSPKLFVLELRKIEGENDAVRPGSELGEDDFVCSLYINLLYGRQWVHWLHGLSYILSKSFAYYEDEDGGDGDSSMRLSMCSSSNDTYKHPVWRRRGEGGFL